MCLNIISSNSSKKCLKSAYLSLICACKKSKLQRGLIKYHNYKLKRRTFLELRDYVRQRNKDRL